MSFTHYVRSGQKLLRCGFTTGSCAALAAAGATRLLLTRSAPERVSLRTPKGLLVDVPLEDAVLEQNAARATVVKDGGDDIDATHGLPIVATVAAAPTPGVTIHGGDGVGRVTRPGLDQPVGEAAINRVPRRMIEEAVRAECEAAGYEGGLAVTISVPGGAAAAARTFNPMLGVTGGISILGTSGIVEPMSQQALVDTIAVEQRQAAALGEKRLLLTPGNYGEAFLHDTGLDALGVPLVKCSNFIGDALDIAAAEGFQTVLLAGHLGKLVKVAGGVMNTHSRWADCRMELLCAHTAACGGDTALCRAVLDCATTDGALALLQEAGLWDAVCRRLLDAIQLHLDRRAAGAFRVGAVVFTNEAGLLGRTPGAEEMIKMWEKP